MYLELYEQFSREKESHYGELTVRTKYENDRLTIQVINAKNLMAMDSNGEHWRIILLNILYIIFM